MLGNSKCMYMHLYSTDMVASLLTSHAQSLNCCLIVKALYRFSNKVSWTCCVQLQMLLMGVWMYAFSYFYYPSVLLAIILLGTCLSVSLTYRQRKMLIKIFAQTRLVPYVHKGCVRATVSQRLVPGDVVVVQQGWGSCDMVLLMGNCLVEESMLSGEVGCNTPISSCLLDCCRLLCVKQQLIVMDTNACNISLVPCMICKV